MLPPYPPSLSSSLPLPLSLSPSLSLSLSLAAPSLPQGIGWHEARVPTIATSVPRAAFSWVTRKLKVEGGLATPLCTTNRINMPAVVEAVLERGDADLVRPMATKHHGV